MPASQLFGREAEVRSLSAACNQKQLRVLSFVGGPGTGKSAVARAGLRGLSRGSARDGPRIFTWALYNQAADEFSRAAGKHLDGFAAPLVTLFFQRAAEFFGASDVAKARTDREMGVLLGEHLLTHGGILFFDGFERMQSNRSGYDGLSHLGLIALLRTIAEGPEKRRCLCVITTQVALTKLGKEYRGAIEDVQLPPLDPHFGGILLKKGGVLGSDGDLEEASRFFGGHPLTLRLLSGYLRSSAGGAIDAACEIPGRDFDSVLTAFDGFFAKDGERAADRQIIRLLGLYDCPADEASLRRVLAGEKFRCLAKDLPDMPRDKWQRVVDRMYQYALLNERNDRVLDTHQLVRGFGANRLLEGKDREAWREGHLSLGGYLQDLAYQEVNDIRRISLLYEAMEHHCKAEDYEGAIDIYWDKIQQGIERKATRQFGIVGPEAFASFFVPTKDGVAWDRLVDLLKNTMLGARVSGYAAEELWIDGRMKDSILASSGGAETNFRIWCSDRPTPHREAARLGQSENARRAAETSMIRGDLTDAEGYGRRSVIIVLRGTFSEATREDVAWQLGATRATLGRVLHIRGKFHEALKEYEESRNRYSEKRRAFIFGFWFAELLIDLGRYPEAVVIAMPLLAEAKEEGLHLDIAYGHLVLGLAALYEGRLVEAGKHFEEALGHVKQSRQKAHLAFILLVVADFHVILELNPAACSELECTDPLGTADRHLGEFLDLMLLGNGENSDEMALYKADLYLVAARLALVRGNLRDASKHVIDAGWVRSHGYGRREAQLSRLELALRMLRNLVDGAVALCPDFGFDRADLLTLWKSAQDWLVGAGRDDGTSTQAGVAPERAPMPRLDLAELAGRVDLKPEQLRRLGERVEELMRPLVEALPLLEEEFGTGAIDREAIRRNVTALVELNLRQSLDRVGTSVGPATDSRSVEECDRQLSARETVDRLRAIRDPQGIQDFLDRYVVGRSWGNLADNYMVATGITDHLRALRLRVECPNDGEPAILRCYPQKSQESGSFRFEHTRENKTQRHLASTEVPALKVVPAPQDPRRLNLLPNSEASP